VIFPSATAGWPSTIRAWGCPAGGRHSRGPVTAQFLVIAPPERPRGISPASRHQLNAPIGVSLQRSVRPWPSTSRRSTPSLISQRKIAPRPPGRDPIENETEPAPIGALASASLLIASPAPAHRNAREKGRQAAEPLAARLSERASLISARTAWGIALLPRSSWITGSDGRG